MQLNLLWEDRMPPNVNKDPAYWNSIVSLLTQRGIAPTSESPIIARTPKTTGKSKINVKTDHSLYENKQPGLVDMYYQNRNFGIGDYL